MSQITYPLGMPEELLNEVKDAAKETGLSMADVMRQAIKLGVPRVRQGLSREEDVSEPATVKFIKKDGYTVGHTDKKVSLERIKELLAEFP